MQLLFRSAFLLNLLHVHWVYGRKGNLRYTFIVPGRGLHKLICFASLAIRSPIQVGVDLVPPKFTHYFPGLRFLNFRIPLTRSYNNPNGSYAK